MWKLS